jgi:hypothetical protein
MFTHAGIKFTGVVITGGNSETIGGQDNYRNVPKLTLISHVQSLLHAGKLKIRKDLPEADTLIRELQDFRVNYSNAGFMSFSAREGKHDDLVLALAIAIWCALREKTGTEEWADFLERRDWGLATDVDAVRAVANPDPRYEAAGPEFGFLPQAIKQHRVRVPDDVGTLFLIDGTQLQIPEDRIVSVSAEDAAAFGMRGWDRLASV